MLPNWETITTPDLLGRVLNRQYYRFTNSTGYNSSGTDIFEEDWDTLLVLDGCRYDLFAEKSSLPGQLSTRESRGAATQEWLKANFDGRELYDTVYVAANPMFHRHQDIFDLQLHSVIDIWDDVWDDDLGTAPPDAVAKAVIDAHEECLNKRIIGHFIQPHYPFISDDAVVHASVDNDKINIWNELIRKTSDHQPADVIDSYRANLEPVLKSVKSIFEVIQGRIVVTADHGNMLGERATPIPTPEWGHPPGVYTDRLVDVPWHVYENGKRGETIAEKGEHEDATHENVEERLADLGYV